MTKEELIEELLHNPDRFSGEMFDDLISSGLNFQDIRECVKRIYDISELQLEVTSNANTGVAGKLNRFSNNRRRKQFNRKILRMKPEEEKNYKLIYAEGDSWFQFPLFITDIIDWLKKRNDYILYSEASGGDWLTNIIYEGQYIPALSVIKPGFFLISGGGNDLVGGNRLAMMVSNKPDEKKYTGPSQNDDPMLSDYQKRQMIRARPYITKEFYAFILIMKAQYTLLFTQLYAQRSTQKELICITHGYDYAIPDRKRHFSVLHPFRILANALLDNGQWLFRPLKLRGIHDPELQRALVMTFIYEFNQMFISLAHNPLFKNVYHIDCRGVAEKPDDWYDELHYQSRVFKKVAKAYEYIIENTSDSQLDSHDKVILAKRF